MGGLCDVSSVDHIVVGIAVLAVAGLHLEQKVIQCLSVNLRQTDIVELTLKS